MDGWTCEKKLTTKQILAGFAGKAAQARARGK